MSNGNENHNRAVKESSGDACRSTSSLTTLPVELLRKVYRLTLSILFKFLKHPNQNNLTARQHLFDQSYLAWVDVYCGRCFGSPN
jgi:hypothetical protein